MGNCPSCPTFSIYEKIPSGDDCNGYSCGQEAQTLTSKVQKKEVLTPEMWENGIIPYSLNHSLDYNKDRIFMAMRTIENYSRIRFVDRTNQKRFLQINKEKGCYYFQDGMAYRRVSLGIGCEDFGTVLHELMFVIGFPHEHTRPDRDKYIVVHWENIVQGKEENFTKLNPNEYPWPDFSFDYHSITLYDEYSFSKNGQKTLEARDGKPIHGIRIGLSKMDKEKLRRI
ncbi:hypothetical protein JTE90_026295 [Oedothorax gibbosus]|uniref:Metalloendopeptidase n=1 Tax=Oedothorax gibbosus TaxID=931172 RepID=A0AAV6U1H7_9ARAC|nr:hypothetical protein JTE90_026295 [Oedothorax gibbosus]